MVVVAVVEVEGISAFPLRNFSLAPKAKKDELEMAVFASCFVDVDTWLSKDAYRP